MVYLPSLNMSFKAILAPIPMSNLMDADDAKDCLQVVTDKLDTRAKKKRKTDADARARQEAADKAAGEARRAKRPDIFERSVHVWIGMDNALRRMY